MATKKLKMSQINRTVVTIFAWIFFIQYGQSQQDQRRLFLGRCDEFKANNTGYESYVQSVSCNTLWTYFRARDFDGFSAKSFYPIATNKTVFYAEYKGPGWIGDGYVTLEDTMAGFIAMRMDRCTQTDDDVIPCTDAIWKHFAASSRGVVNYLVDGDTDKLYNKDGIYKIILPNLTSRVCRVRVVIRRSWNHTENTCSSVDIKSMATETYKSYKNFSCVDDMTAIQEMFCSKAPGAPMCDWLYEKWPRPPTPGGAATLGDSILFAGVAIIIFCFCLIDCCS